jgi:hypothetical protein
MNAMERMPNKHTTTVSAPLDAPITTPLNVNSVKSGIYTSIDYQI